MQMLREYRELLPQVFLKFPDEITVPCDIVRQLKVQDVRVYIDDPIRDSSMIQL